MRTSKKWPFYVRFKPLHWLTAVPVRSSGPGRSTRIRGLGDHLILRSARASAREYERARKVTNLTGYDDFELRVAYIGEAR